MDTLCWVLSAGIEALLGISNVAVDPILLVCTYLILMINFIL
jgi:hypothetical protein